MEEQLSMFSKTKYRITKPIRLIELFSGYGSQALALKYLGIPFEHWKICEWAVRSIQAYKDIHFPDATIEIDMERESMIDFLFGKGISSDYNKPMQRDKISKLKENELKTIIENIKITNNLVNVQNVKGKDLDIRDTNKYTYILTYSFPCQDVSLGGLLKGYADTTTRSGMLWEVMRILKECKELGNMPEILLMENVPMIHSKKYSEDFKKLLDCLSDLGYSNYWRDLSATEFGIPQTRCRTFVVSILGDCDYKFPNAIEIRKVLNDFLEEEVPHKYYFPDDKVKEITFDDGRMDHMKMKNATKREFLEAYQEDGVDILCRMRHEGEAYNTKVIGGIGEKTSNSGTQYFQCRRIYLGNCAITISTTAIPYYIVNERMGGLTIRKLTPRETFRLQGVRDADIDNVMRNQSSDASLYHLSGDSICIDVIKAIFKEML